VERKVVSIFANDLTMPTICLTYNIRVDTDIGATFAQNVQFWIREDKTEDFETLTVAQNLRRNILLASGNQLKSVAEKDVFIQYQKLYAREFWRNYDTKTEKFNTEHLATVIKPYRNFILATKAFIDAQIQKSLLKKGE
jgi:hypothetical protein